MADERNEEKLPWHEELRANVRVAGMSVRAAPLFAFFTFALTAVEGLVMPILVRQTGRFISVLPNAIKDGSASAAARDARHILVVLGVVVAGSQVLKPVKGAFQYGLGRRFQAHLARRVMSGVTGVPGIAHFEDPAFRDKLEVSEWIDWSPSHTIQMVAQMVQQAVQIAGLAAVLAIYSGWMPVLLVASALPAGVAAFNRVKTAGLAIWSDSPKIRRASYYRTLALELDAAKELRLFGLKDWTLTRQDMFWLDGMRETWRRRWVGSLVVMVLRFANIGVLTFVYLVLLHAAINSRIDAGVFMATSTAATQLVSIVTAVFATAAWVRRMNYLLPFVLRLIDLPRKDPRMEARGTRSAHGLVASGIGFEGVRFRYPGTDRWILDGLDLHIAPGQSVALVGENGAGKTTLIKLLCRFYDPTEGRITLDGIDIREFDLADLRRRIACIFQDFTRYELPARDNVGFGAVEHRHEDGLVREAARRVGVLDEIERMPSGWDTPLSRAFDGVDLSGGQWQRIALARAIMAQLGHDADLLILDEPTASLDVRLEHELYEHFAQLAHGRTTILVSHRFSTVRMAERIVFMDAGRVVEDGVHADLVARAGRYAELYNLQAAHYLATGALE